MGLFSSSMQSQVEVQLGQCWQNRIKTSGDGGNFESTVEMKSCIPLSCLNIPSGRLGLCLLGWGILIASPSGHTLHRLGIGRNYEESGGSSQSSLAVSFTIP